MTTQAQLHEFILSLKPNTPDFDVDDNLQENGILDSIAMTELVLWSEETFDFVVDTDDMVPENFSTLGNIVSFVERQIGAS